MLSFPSHSDVAELDTERSLLWKYEILADCGLFLNPVPVSPAPCVS